MGLQRDIVVLAQIATSLDSLMQQQVESAACASLMTIAFAAYAGQSRHCAQGCQLEACAGFG
eukprot:3528346-Amphidinium_carterae.1